MSGGWLRSHTFSRTSAHMRNPDRRRVPPAFNGKGHDDGVAEAWPAADEAYSSAAARVP